MKRILFLIAMTVVFFTVQAHAKEDMNIPSMSGKAEIMEELGLAEHVDPFQYQRAVKKKVRSLTKLQSAKPRQIVDLGAGN
jgi:hypothetical protein